MKRILYGLSILAALSCSTSNPSLVTPPNGVGGSGGTNQAGSSGAAGLWTLPQGGVIYNFPDPEGGAAGADEPPKPIQIITELPDGFVQAEVGGYRLEGPVGQAGSPNGSDDCANIITGVSRDFRSDHPANHPDFEVFAGKTASTGMVEPNLGDDQKPVYTGVCEVGSQPLCQNGPQSTSRANFDQWYRAVEGVNHPYLINIWLAPQPNGLFTFESRFYFPVDGVGFQDAAKADDGKLHNFGFTTEVHTQFLYQGGETFQFKGDDDVWVFINHKLAVDLGGLHSALTASINLDQSAQTLRIETGKVYAFDLFHAERHTDQSTFRIDTNLSFVNCGVVVPEPPPR